MSYQVECVSVVTHSVCSHIVMTFQSPIAVAICCPYTMKAKCNDGMNYNIECESHLLQDFVPVRKENQADRV